MNILKKRYAAAAFALAAPFPAVSYAAGVVVLDEKFNNPNGPAGWTQMNNSVPPGTGWFQGNPDVFTSQSGGPGAYYAADFLSAENGFGKVDNWLISPVLNLSGATTLSFYSMHAGDPGFADQLEVRFASGSGGGAGTFTTLLLTIGAADYPTTWQQFTADLNVSGPGRFAFRYVGDAAALNYVGLDTVRVVSAVPEPSLALMLAMGLGSLGLLRRRTGK